MGLLAEAPVLLDLAPRVGRYHLAAADWAPEQVHVVGTLARERRGLRLASLLRLLEQLGRHYRLVLFLAYLPVFSVLPYGVKLVVFALDLLHASPAIGNLACIDGVVEDVLERLRAKEHMLSVASRLLLVSVLVKPHGYLMYAVRGVDISVEDDSHDLRFVLLYNKLPTVETVPERSLSTVPQSIACLLISSGSRVLADAVSLQIGKDRREREHRLAHFSCAVDALLYHVKAHVIALELL